MTRKNILNLLKEGYSVDEIIDSKLNVVGGIEKTSKDAVSNKATTDSFVDATTQQVGKNRYFGYFLEANSSLQGKHYAVPKEVIEFLQTKQGSEGEERVDNLLNNPQISYEQLKRFKHDIENKYEGDWDLVLSWINTTLNTDRHDVASGKQITHDTGMQNRYKDEHEKDGIHAPKINKHTITESTDYSVYKKKALRDILNTKLKELYEMQRTVNEIKKILKLK